MEDIKTIFLDEEQAKNLQLQSGIYAIAIAGSTIDSLDFGIQSKWISLLNLDNYNNLFVPTADNVDSGIDNWCTLTTYLSKAAYEKLASDKESKFVKKVIAGEQTVVIMRGVDSENSLALTRTKFNLFKKLGLVDSAAYIIFTVQSGPKPAQVYWLCTPGPALD